MTPCPHCGRQPTVERVAPWPGGIGPAPWHVGCYRSGNNEHYVGDNGDTKLDAIAAWERAVAEFRSAQPEKD